MRQNAAGCRIQDLITVAESNGINWRRPGRGGSHVIFSADGIRGIASVPDKRPIKPPYVRQFVALIDAAAGLKEGNRHERENHKRKS